DRLVRSGPIRARVEEALRQDESRCVRDGALDGESHDGIDPPLVDRAVVRSPVEYVVTRKRRGWGDAEEVLSVGEPCLFDAERGGDVAEGRQPLVARRALERRNVRRGEIFVELHARRAALAQAAGDLRGVFGRVDG